MSADPGALPPSPVPSPCVNVCRMQKDTGLCEGCRRTLDEIAAWSRMDDRAKLAVWSELPHRRLSPPAGRAVAGSGAGAGVAVTTGAVIDRPERGSFP
jgi:uncharacterized protein